MQGLTPRAASATRDRRALDRARAFRLLSRRDYSRAELRAKLLSSPPDRKPAACGAPPSTTGEPGHLTRYERDSEHASRAAPDPTWSAAVDTLLEELESLGLLSDRRFAEGVTRRHAARLGVASVGRVLAQKGVAAELAAESLAPLRETERERALALWRCRFDQAPAEPADRARQHRFLLRRGFDAAVVGWVLRHGPLSPDEDD